MNAFERGKNAQRKIHLWIEVFSFCFTLKVPSLHSALPRSTQALLTYLPREHPDVPAQNSPLILPKATDLRAEANSLSQNSDQASSIACAHQHTGGPWGWQEPLLTTEGTCDSVLWAWTPSEGLKSAVMAQGSCSARSFVTSKGSTQTTVLHLFFFQCGLRKLFRSVSPKA